MRVTAGHKIHRRNKFALGTLDLVVHLRPFQLTLPRPSSDKPHGYTYYMTSKATRGGKNVTECHRKYNIMYNQGRINHSGAPYQSKAGPFLIRVARIFL